MEQSSFNKFHTLNQHPKAQSSMQIAKLQNSVIVIAKKNLQKYKKIVDIDSAYRIDLYQPPTLINLKKMFQKQILLNQLDRLMVQQNILDRKLSHQVFRIEQQNQRHVKTLHKQVSPYYYIRQAWSTHNSRDVQSFSNNQRIQSLNSVIGTIKSTINSMLIKESKIALDSASLSNDGINYKQQSLKQKYENTLMENQDLRSSLLRVQINLEEKNNVIESLSKALQQSQKIVKQQRKQKQSISIDHKLEMVALNQKNILIEKQYKDLLKWKNSLEKNLIKNQKQNYKLYFELSQSNLHEELEFKTTSKSLKELIKLIGQQQVSPNPQKSYIYNDQQNNEISIPMLNLGQKTQQPPRRKMATQRINKQPTTRQLQKFLSGANQFKYTKMNSTLNDQSVKKFVRKSQILGTSRNFVAAELNNTFLADQNKK